MDPTIAAAVISGSFLLGVALIKFMGNSSRFYNSCFNGARCKELKSLENQFHQMDTRLTRLETRLEMQDGRG